ncbi:MAG: hypothetical protein ICV68_04945, partial [Pyrinomonadaceae bacterium]|nr:hypothetical protein [Pyrinomonadaceae bacterium]
MKKLYYLTGLVLLLMLISGSALAQRPRVADETPEPQPQDASVKPQPTPQPAPKFATAKYMGGYFGLKQKQEGSLSFDDRNQRLVFRDK